MALAAQARGQEYLALTDHSHYLRDGKLRAQWEEVEAVNERLAPFRVLRGIEVNIRADASLDLSDEDMAACEWVIASLHTVPTASRPSACSPPWRIRTSTASGI